MFQTVDDRRELVRAQREGTVAVRLQDLEQRVDRPVACGGEPVDDRDAQGDADQERSDREPRECTEPLGVDVVGHERDVLPVEHVRRSGEHAVLASGYVDAVAERDAGDPRLVRGELVRIHRS